MENISRDELVERSGVGIYRTVVLAIKRALEIAGGAPKLVDVPLDVKPTTVALLEIAGGKVKARKIKQ